MNEAKQPVDAQTAGVDDTLHSPVAEKAKKQRGVYVKPSIIYDAPLEAMAGKCSPGKADALSCESGVLQS